MKKYVVGLFILLIVSGCSNLKFSEESKYYFKINSIETKENDMNLKTTITNISSSKLNIKYIEINLIDEKGNSVKKIKKEINKEIESYENFNYELTQNIKDIIYKGISITLYKDNNVLIKEISYKEEDINSSVKSITYDKSYLTIELNSDKKLEINNLKIEILDDNLEVKDYMIKSLNITLEPNVNKVIKININKELGKNLKFINLIET